MKDVTPAELLRILEEEQSSWPPFVAKYGGKWYAYVRVKIEGEKDLLFRTEVEG